MTSVGCGVCSNSRYVPPVRDSSPTEETLMLPLGSDNDLEDTQSAHTIQDDDKSSFSNRLRQVQMGDGVGTTKAQDTRESIQRHA